MTVIRGITEPLAIETTSDTALSIQSYLSANLKILYGTLKAMLEQKWRDREEKRDIETIPHNQRMTPDSEHQCRLVPNR